MEISADHGADHRAGGSQPQRGDQERDGRRQLEPDQGPPPAGRRGTGSTRCAPLSATSARAPCRRRPGRTPGRPRSRTPTSTVATRSGPICEPCPHPVTSGASAISGTVWLSTILGQQRPFDDRQRGPSAAPAACRRRHRSTNPTAAQRSGVQRGVEHRLENGSGSGRWRSRRPPPARRTRARCVDRCGIAASVARGRIRAPKHLARRRPGPRSCRLPDRTEDDECEPDGERDACEQRRALRRCHVLAALRTLTAGITLSPYAVSVSDFASCCR